MEPIKDSAKVRRSVGAGERDWVELIKDSAKVSGRVLAGLGGTHQGLSQGSWECGCRGRVPTRPGKPGKPGKMRVHLENLEISWNFEKFNKYHGKMI